jgi:FG-GAP-like repeat
MSRSIADTAICSKTLRGSLGTESFNVSVLLGNGDGTFQAARNLGAGFDPTSVAVGDFNADGLPDPGGGQRRFGQRLDTHQQHAPPITVAARGEI